MLPTKEKWVVYFNFGLIALIGLIFPIAGIIYFKDQLLGIWPWLLLCSLCLATIGFLILFYLRKNKIKPVFYLSIWFIISVICFGLPMAKYIEINPSYKSIVSVDNYRLKNPMPVYEYRSFSPEIIWEYGQPIKTLWDGEKYNIPGHDEFLLLSTKEELDSMQYTFFYYRIEKLDEIDMNPVGGKSKPRLYRDLYLIKRK